MLVGRGAPGKGQHLALHALTLLSRAGLDLTLTLVGSGGPRYDALLASIAARAGVADRVRLVGQVADPTPYVLGADVALVPSRAEAFGRVTVEAMKLGRPVVGAASGGTLELVQDNVTGLLHPPDDSGALADQVARLYHDRALLARLGARAREWATAAFTHEQYAADLTAVLFEAAGRGVRNEA